MVVPIRLAKSTCAGRLIGPGVEGAVKISGAAYIMRARNDIICDVHFDISRNFKRFTTEGTEKRPGPQIMSDPGGKLRGLRKGAKRGKVLVRLLLMSSF